jgi:hypothetical protein
MMKNSSIVREIAGLSAVSAMAVSTRIHDRFTIAAGAAHDDTTSTCAP